MGTSSGGTDYGNLAKTLAPLFLSLFGSNPYKDKASGSADQLAALSKLLGEQGGKTMGQGAEALTSVMKLLQGLASGAPGAIDAATAPERASILSQYDTARATAARTQSGRSGGSAAGNLASYVEEAGKLTTTKANARTQAATGLGTLGTDLTQAGTSEMSLSAQAMSAAQAAYQQQSEQQSKELAGIGTAIGAALPFILMAL